MTQNSLNIDEIKVFFNKFPFKGINDKNIVDLDYCFFEMVLPKIQKQKTEEAITAPSLNIFKGIGVGRDEVRNCAILSWFMNPNESHAQGSLFMDVFFREIKGLNDFAQFIKEGYFNVRTEVCHGDNGRVDIQIHSNDFMLIIEAKIYASEQNMQIDRYRKMINLQQQVYSIKEEYSKILFLTLSGYKPTTGAADISISWNQIAKILKIFSEESKNDLVCSLAIQYADHISSL